MAIDGNRIRAARNRSGLSVADLAESCGVSVRSVSSWEHDGAPATNAPALATATAMPETFFLREHIDAVAEEAIFFRARRRAGASLLRRSTAVSLMGTDFYSEVTRTLRLPTLNLPASGSLSPETAARELRRAWRVGTDAIPNLTQLAEAHGVRVLGLPDPESEVDAFSYWSAGSPFVVLARMKTAERARFDLAHELGHLVMHSDTHGDDRVTDRQLEHEANRFAAEFLVPRETLRACVQGTPSLSPILDLKSRFGVSAQAMTYGLKDAGRLSDWATRQMMSELDRQGFLKGEPGSRLTWERSRIFEALPKALRTKGIAPGSWVSRIGQRREDVLAFTFGQMMLAV